MLAIEYYPPDTTHKYFTYHAVIKAIIASVGHDNVIIWNHTNQNMYDLYDESKPDKLIYHNMKHTNVSDKLNIDGWCFNNWYNNDTLIADDTVYKTLGRDDNLYCKTVCIAPYSDVDSFDDKVFLEYMDNSIKNFRYFGTKNFGGHKDCGFISENAHSLLLSSAEEVVALSKQFAVNAKLCNKNIINYDITDEELNKYYPSQIIQAII